jgi:hypothetical protein
MSDLQWVRSHLDKPNGETWAPEINSVNPSLFVICSRIRPNNLMSSVLFISYSSSLLRFSLSLYPTLSLFPFPSLFTVHPPTLSLFLQFSPFSHVPLSTSLSLISPSSLSLSLLFSPFSLVPLSTSLSLISPPSLSPFSFLPLSHLSLLPSFLSLPFSPFSLSLTYLTSLPFSLSHFPLSPLSLSQPPTH